MGPESCPLVHVAPRCSILALVNERARSIGNSARPCAFASCQFSPAHRVETWSGEGGWHATLKHGGRFTPTCWLRYFEICGQIDERRTAVVAVPQRRISHEEARYRHEYPHQGSWRLTCKPNLLYPRMLSLQAEKHGRWTQGDAWCRCSRFTSRRQ